MKNRTLKKIRKMLPSEAKEPRAGLVIVALRSICLDLCSAAFFQMCLCVSLSLLSLFLHNSFPPLYIFGHSGETCRAGNSNIRTVRQKRSGNELAAEKSRGEGDEGGRDGIRF